MTLALIRPTQLYIWKGPSLLLVDERGECGEREQLSGYYFREARFLRTLRFEVNGRAPWLCDASLLDTHSVAFTYTHPELTQFGGGGSGQSGDEVSTGADGLPHRGLSLRLVYELSIDRLMVSVTISNHSLRRIEADVAWALDADFADIQEAHEGRRDQHGDVHQQAAGDRLALSYQHPKLKYRTQVMPTGATIWVAGTSSIETRVELEPQQMVVLGLRVDPSTVDGSAPFDDSREREARHAAWQVGLARISVPGNRAAERTLAANVRDFASFPLLEGQPDEWLTLQAGMPLYPALFGRDTLTAGWQAAFLDRGASLDASLTRLGRMQSHREDDWRDEEPGRLPYQVRQGPLALLDVNPYAAYYADFASPLMFVVSLAHLYAWTGERKSIERHWDVARRILDWAGAYGDKDRDGYLEYQTRSPKGTKNQGWKDSGDAIVYEDGRPVPPPLGTCELQGYWFAAQQLMAFLCGALGEYADAKAHWRSASALKDRFNRDWWDDDEGCVVLALDPDKQPVRAVTSNAAHCLAAGIISDKHLARLVGRLFAPDMFSGWGIRTLSSTHRAYNPLSYHLGTVWPVEQATAAFGLRRFGFDARASELAHASFDLAELYPEHRIPECIGGYPRYERNGPGAYPRANTPQLWNASAFPLFIHTLLGFQPVAPLETLFVDPVLPTWLPEIVIEGLRLAGATATLRFWRDGSGSSHAEILYKRGTFHLVKQPPPESLNAGIFDRLSALVDSVRH